MVINKGSVETMVVSVVDNLEQIVELPSGTLYDIYDTDGNPEVQNQVAVVNGMEARCLINTTNLAADDYDLFVKFSSAGETPIIGPHRFRVTPL